MAIRPAAEEDVSGLARLTAELGYAAEEREVSRRLEAVLGRCDRMVFVAVGDDGGIVGWIDVADRPLLQEADGADIEGLVVAEDCRGSGVGRALVQRAEDWARRRGLAVIRVRSRGTRAGAHRFYESLGYEVVKTSVAFRRVL